MSDDKPQEQPERHNAAVSQLDFYVNLQEKVLDAAMYSLTLDRRVQFWNSAAERIFGWSAEEVVGHKLSEFLQIDFMSGKTFGSELENFLRQGHWVGELTQRHKDGNLVYVLSSALLFKDQQGNPVSIVVVSHDLTQQRKAESALHESEERYRAIYRDTPSMFFTLAADGTIVSVNEFGASQLGYEIEELVGQSILLIFHEADRAAVTEQLQICLQHPRQVFRGEFRKIRKDGSLMWIESFARMVIDAANEINVLTVCQDITERKKADTILSQAFEKEKELSELKSRFVSMASHEFRTPLASILSSAEMISTYRHRMQEDQIEQRLENIRLQVDYLRDIVEDVLQYSGLQGRESAFKPDEIDLDALVREITNEFESQHLVHHPLIYELEGEAHPVRLDKQRMRQVISNLVSNAIKYSPETKPVRITLQQRADEILLSVQDEGIGVPESDIHHLFEPFHRAANVETISGTGLGLSIVKQAIELHGGKISVSSRLGVGTTFTVRIPTGVVDAGDDG